MMWTMQEKLAAALASEDGQRFLARIADGDGSGAHVTAPDNGAGPGPEAAPGLTWQDEVAAALGGALT